MRRVCIGLLFIVLLSVKGQAQTAPAGRFQRFDFKLKGEITDVITEDLDGDGLDEALAVHVDQSTDPPQRHLAIFRQDQDGFDLKKRTDWTFPPEVAAIDVGDVAADPGRELCFITEDGVSYAVVRDGKVGALKSLFPAPSMVAIAYERGVPYYNFVRDYTGDGKDDALVVGFARSLFAKQTAPGEFAIQELRLRPRMDIQAFDVGKLLGDSESPMFRVAYYAPQVNILDTNNDGLTDLVVNFESRVLVFTQNAQGFSIEPAQVYDLKLMADEDRHRPGRNRPNFAFADLDRDGRMDVLATQSQGGLANMTSRTVLYWGNGDDLAKNQPSQEFKLDNTVMSIFVRDVNNDKLPDLIMPTMNLGAWTAGKVLITGGLTVTWNIFLQRPGHKFNNAPDRSFNTDLKFNISKFQLDSGIPNVFGDFNGDGFPDEAVGADKDLLVVNLRDQNGQLMGIEERIAIPSSMFNRAIDLNRDGKSDIVINYEEESDYASEFHILINRGSWSK
ncbi:MAG TPA: VCBS repeat-containing protein [bacterium]|nr:VCBS repeat-containing protein [bacterium]